MTNRACPLVQYLRIRRTAVFHLRHHATNAGQRARAGFASVDFSLTKNVALSDTMRLQVRGEFFNLFNRVNLNQPNVNFLSGGFGEITSADVPRRAQFGVKLYF